MAAKPDPHLNKWSDSDVEKHWDNVAGIYVSENNKVSRVHDQRFNESIMNLDLAPGLRILNITSRDGGADDYLRKNVPDLSVIHAEISSGLMNVAAEIRPHITQVKLSTYSKLPFPDQSFDRILSLETLEHVSDPVSFLKELHRVSTSKARMVLSCPPATGEFLYRIYTFLFGGHGEGPHRFLSSEEVKVMLKKTGWTLLEHRATLLTAFGPVWFQDAGERIIKRSQGTFIAELGVRQFYICNKAG